MILAAAISLLTATAWADEDSQALAALAPTAGGAFAESPVEVPEDPNYERLLGGAEAEPTATSVVSMPELPNSAWLLGLAAVVGLAVARFRTRGRGPEEAPLRVVGRASMGREGSLAIVEVADGNGGVRRLLVGAGGGGPRLLADLDPAFPARVEVDTDAGTGAPFPVSTDHSQPTDIFSRSPKMELPTPVVPIEEEPRVASPSLARPKNPIEVKGDEGGRRLDPAWEKALKRAQNRLESGEENPKPKPGSRKPGSERNGKAPRKLRVLPSELEQRDDLIAEVLAEREGRHTGRRSAEQTRSGRSSRGTAPSRRSGRGFVA